MDGGQRRFNNSDSGPLAKRRIVENSKVTIFSRLSGPSPLADRYDFDDQPKPRVSSRVTKDQPTREDIVAAQTNDEETKARHKRMFGALLGTLQKFCQEESKLKPKEEKKAKIEKKLELQQKREREILRKEKQTLFSDRRKQQLEIRLLEIKMIKMRDYADWEAHHRPLAKFIRSKNKPYIYYLPKVSNKRMEERLKRSQEEMEKLIEKRQKQVQDEIAQVEERFADEIKSVEKNGASSDAEPFEDNYERTSDTEVSLVERNVERIAFDSDGEDHQSSSQTFGPNVLLKVEKVEKGTNGEAVKPAASPRSQQVQNSRSHSSSSSSMIIKKEKTDWKHESLFKKD